MKGPVVFVVALLVSAGAGALVASAPRPAPRDLALAPSGFTFLDDGDGEPARVARLTADETLRASVALCPQLLGSCASAVGSPAQRVEVASAHGARTIELEVTWAASSPSTQQLEASLHACAQACGWPHQALAVVTSGSPLTIRVSMEDLEVGRDARFYLEITTPDGLPGGVGAHVRPTSQPFHVAATVLYA